MYCANCGKKINERSSRCSFCGSQVDFRDNQGSRGKLAVKLVLAGVALALILFIVVAIRLMDVDFLGLIKGTDADSLRDSQSEKRDDRIQEPTITTDATETASPGEDDLTEDTQIGQTGEAGAELFHETYWIWSRGPTNGTNYSAIFHPDGTMDYIQGTDGFGGTLKYEYQEGVLSINGVDYTLSDGVFTSNEKQEIFQAVDGWYFTLTPDEQQRYREIKKNFTITGLTFDKQAVLAYAEVLDNSPELVCWYLHDIDCNGIRELITLSGDSYETRVLQFYTCKDGTSYHLGTVEPYDAYLTVDHYNRLFLIRGRKNHETGSWVSIYNGDILVEEIYSRDVPEGEEYTSAEENILKAEQYDYSLLSDIYVQPSFDQCVANSVYAREDDWTFSNGATCIVMLKDGSGQIVEIDLNTGKVKGLFRAASDATLLGVTNDRIYIFVPNYVNSEEGYNDYWGFNVYSYTHSGEDAQLHREAVECFFQDGYFVLTGYRSDIKYKDLLVIDSHDQVLVEDESVWDAKVYDGNVYFLHVKLSPSDQTPIAVEVVRLDGSTQTCVVEVPVNGYQNYATIEHCTVRLSNLAEAYAVERYSLLTGELLAFSSIADALTTGYWYMYGPQSLDAEEYVFSSDGTVTIRYRDNMSGTGEYKFESQYQYSVSEETGIVMIDGSEYTFDAFFDRLWEEIYDGPSDAMRTVYLTHYYEKPDVDTMLADGDVFRVFWHSQEE